MATQKPKLTAAARRKIVAAEYLEGYSQSELAEKLGVSQATISRDITVVHEQWVSEYAFEVNEAKCRELARIDKLELEYWRQYEESKKPKKRTGKKGRVTGEGENASIKTGDVTELVEERTGDTKYLSGVQWCIEQRCKIIGIYAAIRQDVTGSVDVKTGTLAEWQAERERQEAALQEMAEMFSDDPKEDAEE